AVDPRAGKTGVAGGGLRCFDEALPLLTLRGKLGDVLVDPAGVDVAGNEMRMCENVAQEADVGGDALEAKLAERPRLAAHGDGKIRRRRMGNHLCKQRVI